MDILVGKRQQGKTTHLIRMSAVDGKTIVTFTEREADHIMKQAKEMGLNIPEPIHWNRLVSERGRRGPYLVDELGMILSSLNVEVATLDEGCSIKDISSFQSHYGNGLAAEIQKNTTDFSKLSVFDKFVLNNGHRYGTREELQAGYHRHWKAAHDILITAEEFFAEAGKQLKVPVSGTYKALVTLVEEKKLHPGEVLAYAHYHWCLNKPEAIVAYRTGRDEWAVNNCDTEITEEGARIKICEEWGFEAGRVHIIGIPYYDATDYQFIRFNCSNMSWLWRNGSLLQVYC